MIDLCLMINKIFERKKHKVMVKINKKHVIHMTCGMINSMCLMINKILERKKQARIR